MWWDRVAAYGAARRGTGNEWLLLPKGFASFTRRCPVRLAPSCSRCAPGPLRPPLSNEVSKSEMAYFRASLRASLQQADVIFTPTEFTSREIQRMAGERAGPSRRLFAAAKAFSVPRKNRQSAPRTFLCWPAVFHPQVTRQAVDFFRVGSRNVRFRNPCIGLAHCLRDWRRRRSQFRWHPRLPEKEFRELMATSRVVVFTSEYEGLGVRR